VRRPKDILLLLGLTLLAALAGMGFLARHLDRENLSMQSRSTPQAAVESLRDRTFGRQSPLLFMLQPLTRGDLDPLHDANVPIWTAGLRALPWVRQVSVLPQSHAQALYLAVLVEDAPGGRFFERVRRTVDVAWRTRPAGYHLHVTGQPLGEMAVAHALSEESARVVPLVLGALFLLLLGVYRRAILAAGVLASALLGILVLGGLQWLLGLAIDPVSSLLPPVLLTVGVAGSVHLVEAFLARRARGHAAGEAAREAARALRRPGALTASTTIVGFLALLGRPIPAVRQFGLLAAAGVALTTLFTFLWLPAWLRLFAGGAGFASLRRPGGPWAQLAGGLALVLRRRARAVTVAALLVVLVFAWSWSGLQVDTQPLKVLPAHGRFRRETASVAHSLGGIESFDLLLPAPPPGRGPGNYLGLCRALGQEPLVAGVLGLPERAPSGLGRQRVLLRPSGTGPRERLFERLEARARTLGWPGAVAAGAPVLVARDSNELVASQLRGMALTLLFLWIAMSIGLRSPGLGLLGLIPNVVPAVVLYGGLALAGRPLSVGSAMIGSVLLGLMVDDTIHFLFHYRQARRRGAGPLRAAARSLRVAGRALVVTTLVEALGFLVCVLGALASSREFAVLASGTMLVALAADLFLLPALLLARRRAPEPA
jgi:hypothetical protein